jgi:ribonuclease HI
LDQRNWGSSYDQRASLVYRRVQDAGEDWGWGLWAVCEKKAQFSLGKYATVFQAEVFAILACVHDIKVHGTPEKYVSICSDSQAALKALRAVRTMSPLVYQCQRPLNDISAQHAVGLYWVPGHAGINGNETADELARCGSALGFIEPEPALGVSRQDLRNRNSRWMG